MKSSHEETWRLAQGVSNLDMCSPVDWSRVDAWIEACEVGHGLCQRLISNTRQAVRFLSTLTIQYIEALTDSAGKGDPKPARIIYLGRGPKDTITARLQDTRDFALMPAYATMSHCWGTDMPTKLTQNVYELFHEQLPLQSIPTKFVQAMHVTKKLGLQYLWIDVLCIVQDDDSECLNEVAQMHHIYQHAQFNIAAANSSSWEYPLWSDSSRLRTDVVVVYPGWTNMEMYCVDEGLWHNNIGQSPLLKRGWVLQEISLAPRNLYFGKSQMFWECASLQASETWPSGLPKAVNTNKGKLAMATEIQLQLDPQKQSGRRSPRTSNGDRKKPSFLHLWPEVIKRYTSAELSRPDKDKLAALSGLANFVHDPMFYLAGLWIPQLPYTLAWCALSPTDPPTAYQAPSWSWAAINGNVRLPPLCLWDYKQTATLIDHRIERSGSSRTGRVLGGRIIIKSRMARGLIEHAWTESAPINSSTPTAVQAIELGPVVIHICPDRSGTIENRELYFLEIDSLRGLDRVIGIVLERNFFIKAGYYRVGYFQVARVIDIEGLQEQKYGRVEPNSIAFQHLCHDFWNSAVPTEYIGRLSGWMEVSIT